MSQLKSQRVVCLDIETAVGFDQIAELKGKGGPEQDSNKLFAQHGWLAVTSLDGENFIHWPKQLANNLLTYLSDKITVGWNISSFDLPIVEHTCGTKHSGTVFDMMKEISHRTGGFYKLQDVAMLNLQQGKLMDSGAVPGLFQTDQLSQVYAHCEHDVRLELALYRRAMNEGLHLPALKANKHLPNGLAAQHLSRLG